MPGRALGLGRRARPRAIRPCKRLPGESGRASLRARWATALGCLCALRAWLRLALLEAP